MTLPTILITYIDLQEHPRTNWKRLVMLTPGFSDQLEDYHSKALALPYRAIFTQKMCF